MHNSRKQQTIRDISTRQDELGPDPVDTVAYFLSDDEKARRKPPRNGPPKTKNGIPLKHYKGRR